MFNMSDESFDSLFSEFIELFDRHKLTIMQKYQPVIFTIKIFSRKKDAKFPFSYVLCSLETLQLKCCIVSDWSPFYLQVMRVISKKSVF